MAVLNLTRLTFVIMSDELNMHFSVRDRRY